MARKNQNKNKNKNKNKDNKISYKQEKKDKEKPIVRVSEKTPPPQKTSEQRATLEQKRAEHAWAKSAEGVALHGKDYVNSVKGLPALIMNSGLMQTLAFLQQKGGRHELLSLHLRQWLKLQYETPDDFEAFMQRLFEATPQQFQSYNREAYAWLRWLRQMAAARLGDDKGSNDE